MTDTTTIELEHDNAAAKSASVFAIQAILLFAHLGAACAILYFPLSKPLFIATLTLFLLEGFGITLGYHRLWAHRAFKANSLLIRIPLMIMGTMAVQGSIIRWAREHRLHHRYTDTEHDPYNSKRGLFYSHIGWLLESKFLKKLHLIDISDLKNDPVIKFQHRNYFPLVIYLKVILPAVIGYVYSDGDWLGGFLWIGCVSKILNWHSTWLINSIAHYSGIKEFQNDITAAGGHLLAVMTLGEGYHNFHHAFPKDYRNGYAWYMWDPTKWIITFLYSLGLATDLTSTSAEDINRAKILTRNSDSDDYHDSEPSFLDNLPLWTRKDVQDAVTSGKNVFIYRNKYIVDLGNYSTEHPGGCSILEKYTGKNVSSSLYYDGPNRHSRSALLKLEKLCIAKLKQSIDISQ